MLYQQPWGLLIRSWRIFIMSNTAKHKMISGDWPTWTNMGQKTEAQRIPNRRVLAVPQGYVWVPRSWSKMSSKCRLWPTRALQTVKHVPPCLEKSTLTVPNMFHYCIEQREKTHDESWGKKQYPSPQLLSLDPIWAHPRWPARLLKKLLAVFGVISGQQVRETQGVTQQSGRSWDFRGPLLGKWLVGALEPWNFMTFHIIIGNVIIPTDFHSIIFQRGRYTTNQMMINVDPICFLMFFFQMFFLCHFSDAAT